MIEWADADEGGLDELRAKTAARFRPDEEEQPVSKKQRKMLDLAEQYEHSHEQIGSAS